ncbi:MAG: hypothetical protein ABI690_28410 [Chloroflexota bacterium]
MDRFKQISLTSRTIYILVIGVLIVIGLYAFFNSRVGQAALLVCCGGAILLVIVGVISEGGMKRPR